jgi:hypothetical protein
VVGPAGIGKSRLVAEATAQARELGVEVFSTFGESHASDIPFLVGARLLRDATGIADLDDEAARARLLAQLPETSADDILLLNDLMGIRDPNDTLPPIDPDARKRRLTALINSMAIGRTKPAVYVIEDVHWIDEISESMFADFLAVVSQTHSVVLLTYRPDYKGALAHISGAQTISLALLADSETDTLLEQLLGNDPSIAAIKTLITDRAAGNPFFAQEMVRELAGQGILQGGRGAYRCSTDTADVRVPATLQATIAARIDRFDAAAKKTLNAAAVIGSRFTSELIVALGVVPDLEGLLRGDLVDQVRFTPYAEYAFRHPLIRAVAYESQLKSDRADLHRRLAVEIESRDPAAADENAALIAEHMEAAGEFRDAYNWHMRAGGWSTGRNLVAANTSWERARRVADMCSVEEADRAALVIAPLAMLCGIGWVAHADIAPRFEELRELCTLVGDKRSMAIGMTGLIVEHMVHARMRQASRLASEHIALIESIDDPTLMLGLSLFGALGKLQTAETSEALRWSENVVDLAEGDPIKGKIFVGSPLAMALGSPRHLSILAGSCWVAGRPRPGCSDVPYGSTVFACLRREYQVRPGDYTRGTAS